MLLRARMRVTATWGDVCILNISSRGLQLQSARPPQRGRIVEIRRGPHVVIGCVVWSKQHRFGIRSQDALFVDAIVSEPADGDLARSPTHYVPAERRSARRKPTSEDKSRLLGRALEFACLGILVLAGATILYGAAQSALAAPLASVSGALGD